MDDVLAVAWPCCHSWGRALGTGRVAKLISILSWTVAVALLVATILGQLDRIDLGEAGWLFDLFAHFPRHLAFGGLVVALAAGALRQFRPAVISAGVAAVNIAVVIGVGGFVSPAALPQGGSAAELRIVSANVHGNVQTLRRLAELARNYDADLVAVFEAPQVTDEEAEALFAQMGTVRVARKSPDGRAISKPVLFAARPASVGQIAMMPYGRSNRVILRFKLTAGSQPVRMILAHPVSPDSPAGMRDRNLLLSHIADGLNQAEPFVLMGDMNATPWSRIYGQLPGVRAGDPRFSSTFPASAPAIGIPIDHIKFGGGLMLTECHVGPDIGSDHRPLFAAFTAD
jgi:endonuclease/exonuclease/phosphatase (EEP) superfamily protein YafD